MTSKQPIQILILRIEQAIRLANISICLGTAAIASFCIFGTLASMQTFSQSLLIYYAFHYLPYLLIGLSMPISLFHLFLLLRYRLLDANILMIVFGTGFSLLLFSFITYAITGATKAFFMGLFLAMIAWFGMPFLFRVNLKRFLDFLKNKQENNHHE